MDLKWIPVALGATVVGLALYQASKVHQIEKALSTTVNSMADMTTVTIQDEMVKRAVEKATDREVGNAIQTASRSSIIGLCRHTSASSGSDRSSSIEHRRGRSEKGCYRAVKKGNR